MVASYSNCTIKISLVFYIRLHLEFEPSLDIIEFGNIAVQILWFGITYSDSKKFGNIISKPKLI